MSKTNKSNEISNGASADENKSANSGTVENSTGQEGIRPELRVMAQYIKDLSFENPNAPNSFQSTGKPNINININVTAERLGKTQFEVLLKIAAKAVADEEVMFNVELIYGGVFELVDVAMDKLHPVVLIECPRMLFPFARQVVFDSTRNGGYPPLMLDPIDFADLYHKNLAEQYNLNGEERTIN